MKNVILGMWAFLLTLVLPLPTLAAGLNGAELSIGWVLPFAGILLCIAICPLAVPHFWHGTVVSSGVCNLRRRCCGRQCGARTYW